MFASDRDIALVEPSVFRDLVWFGQLLTRGLASVNDTVLEASSLDNPFTESGVGEGSVVVVGGVTLEVVGVLTESVLDVSRLRERADTPRQPAIDIATAPMHVMTFRPQLEIVHRQVLTMLGMSWAGAPGVLLPATRIMNPGDFVHVEVLGALAMIYAAGGSALAHEHPINQRSRSYRQRFQDERSRVVAQIDADGDGVADVLRRMNVGQLVRW